MLPVHQIAAAGVPPMLVPAPGRRGVELIEEVVPASIVNRAVRIVVPVGWRVEMIDGAIGIRLRECNGRVHGERSLSWREIRLRLRPEGPAPDGGGHRTRLNELPA